MLVSIELHDQDRSHDLVSMHHWLSRNADLVRHARVRLRSADSGPHMGAMDVIDVVLSNTLAAASLLVAYRAWRESRTDPPTVEFEINGIRIVVTDATPETLEALTEAMRALPPPGHDAA
jgi:hypothetical protein